MPTLAELRNTFAPEARTESRAGNQEVLISDIRSHVRSPEIIERKLQAALESARGCSLQQSSPRHRT